MYLELQQQSTLIGRRPTGFIKHYYTEWDDGLGKEKISLFFLLSIDSTQVPGSEIGKEAFQLLQDHFLDDLTGDPYDRFEAALQEINLMVHEKEKELDLKFIPNMNVVAGVIQKDMLFLSQRGAAQGYLLRKRHVSSITDGLSDQLSKEDLFQNIASGLLEVGDSVIFATGNLVKYITPSDLSKIFTEENLQNAVKELSELLNQDLEDQIALLSFEVLEKSHVPVNVQSDGINVDPTTNLYSDKKTLEKSLAVLRKWLLKKERWAYLNRIKAWDRKRLITAISAVLGLLFVGVFVLNVSLTRTKKLEDLESKLKIAEDNVTQAATRGAFDKNEARELLSEAEAFAIEVLDSGYFGGPASQLLDDIREQRNFLDNIKVMDDGINLLADFSDFLGDSEIVGVQPVSDRLVVYTANEAYQVLLGDVQEPDILDAREQVRAGAYFKDRDLIVYVTDEGNVIEYADGNAQFADTADGSFKFAVDVASYSSRIYLLDPEEGEIWKYTRGTNSYGSALPYLSEDIDISNAISMAIDGSVWLLNEDGSILRLLSGEKVDFNILKAPITSLEGASDIYTELEISQIYVLDPDRNRILIYDKSGRSNDITYSQQYVFENLKGRLTDLYMDKDRNVLVISTTQALYEL